MNEQATPAAATCGVTTTAEIRMEGDENEMGAVTHKTKSTFLPSEHPISIPPGSRRAFTFSKRIGFSFLEPVECYIATAFDPTMRYMRHTIVVGTALHQSYLGVWLQ